MTSPIVEEQIKLFEKKFSEVSKDRPNYYVDDDFRIPDMIVFLRSFASTLIEKVRLENEVWVDIQGFEGRYQVSSMGNVRSLYRVIVRGNKKSMTIDPKNLSKISDSHGYYLVNLAKDGVISHSKIHKLVAAAFIKNTFNKKHINHIDGVKTNNCVQNLEWATPMENVHHAIRTGLMGKNWKLKTKLREMR